MGGGPRRGVPGPPVALAVQTAVFQAPEAGTCTLAYGGTPRADVGKPGPPPAARPLWLEPGAETEHGAPYLPSTATAPTTRLGPPRRPGPRSLPSTAPAPTTRLEPRRQTASWRIVAPPTIRPGSLVRLELPAQVY